MKLALLLLLLSGEISYQLEGDGRASDRVRLWCRNSGKQKVSVEIAQFTVFRHPQLQDLMALEKRKLDVPPNGKVQCSLSTMCVGAREEKPPSQPVEYEAVACQQHPEGERARELLTTAQRLCKDGSMPPLPMAPGIQASVVAQFAFWKLKREDIQTLVFSSLKPKAEEEPEAQKGVDNIFEAVDLTSKGSK